MPDDIACLAMAAWSAGTRDRGKYYREIGEDPSRMSRDRIISIAKGSEPTNGENLLSTLISDAWADVSARFSIPVRHPSVVGDFVEHYQMAFYRDGET